MEVKSYYQKNKIFEIPLNKVFPEKFINVSGVTEEEILSAAAKIKKFGLLHPICIRKNIAKDGTFLYFGKPTDFLALKYLSAEKVPAIIYSYTRPEAILFYLMSEKNLDIFKKAELFKFLLKKGNYTVKEICDIFKISPSHLDLLLIPLTLKKGERETFLLKGFGYQTLSLFLKIKENDRENVLNDIVAKDLGEKEAQTLLKEALTKKEKPLKAAFLKNDTVIMNSMSRLSKNLEAFGISSFIEKEEKDNLFEYKLVIKSSPSQLCFDFETIS